MHHCAYRITSYVLKQVVNDMLQSTYPRCSIKKEVMKGKYGSSGKKIINYLGRWGGCECEQEVSGGMEGKRVERDRSNLEVIWKPSLLGNVWNQ